MIRLAAPAFRWTSAEQEYNLEVGPNGEQLYAKEVDIGALPDSGIKEVAHNITSFDAARIFREDHLYVIGSTQTVRSANSSAGYSIAGVLTVTNVYTQTSQNWGSLGATGKCRIIYWK